MKPLLILKLAVGFLALLFGAIGLVLPLWPTTPFVLLALACFSSTPKIRNRILRIRYFREYYESYTQGQGLRRQTVVISLLFLWGMLTLSGLLVRRPLVIAILLLVGIAVTAHILWVARARPNRNASLQERADESQQS